MYVHKDRLALLWAQDVDQTTVGCRTRHTKHAHSERDIIFRAAIQTPDQSLRWVHDLKASANTKASAANANVPPMVRQTNACSGKNQCQGQGLFNTPKSVLVFTPKCTNAQMHKCSNAQMLKRTTSKCQTNAQIPQMPTPTNTNTNTKPKNQPPGVSHRCQTRTPCSR